MAMRRHIDSATEAQVLTQSARRCCLCHYLDGDFYEKEGQIAHLDHDAANSAKDNLAFLCLKHHSLYDSRNSQHKNYTITEVKSARERLHAEAERRYNPCEWILVLDRSSWTHWTLSR